MANISTITDEDVSGIGLGPEHGIIKTRINEIITKVNGMDTPSELPYTPTVTADWPGTDPTTVQGALDKAAERITDSETDIAAIVDDHIKATCTPLPAQTDEAEVSAALNGDADKFFVPDEIVVRVVSATGTVAGNATLNVGTSAGGTQIASGVAFTGLDAANKARRIPIAAATYAAIAANATLYANVESNDTTATTLVLAVTIHGRQY